MRAGSSANRRWALGAALGYFISRSIVAVTDHGIAYPDEIFQSLEPAHKLAFGYGSLAWEFRDGLRSWLFPAVLAVPMKLAAWLGVSTGVGIVVAAKCAVIACFAGAVYSALAAPWLSGGAVVWAAALLLSFPPLVVYGARAMGEMMAAALLLFILVLLQRRGVRRAALAGLLMGCCTFVRYQTGLLAPLLMLGLLVRRRWRDAAAFVGAGTVFALLAGYADAWTYSGPFHSLLAYVHFNGLKQGASRWGVHPPDFYWQTYRSTVGWLALPLAVASALSLARRPMLGFLVMAFAAAHSLVPHKEFRFLLPLMPVFCLAAAVGLEQLFGWLPRFPARSSLRWVLAAALLGTLAVRSKNLTFADLDQGAAQVSPWHYAAGINLGLSRAGSQPDVCGVVIEGVPGWLHGGYSYLHRDVTLVIAEVAMWQPHANYAIVPEGMVVPPSFVLQATQHGFTLLRRPGACTAPPDYYRRPLE